MRVEYKTIIRDTEFDKYRETYTLDSFDSCCERMAEAFDGVYGAVVFGEDDKHRNPMCSVCILEPRHYPEGCHNEYVKINYCPFCGGEIETVEAKRVKEITEEKTVEQTVTKTKEVEISEN